MNPEIPEAIANDPDLSALPGRGHGFVRNDWIELFQLNNLHSLEDFFSISGEALSKPGLGKRYRAKLTLSSADGSSIVFFKRYDGEKLKSLLQRWREDGKRAPIAEREVRISEKLKRIGIETFAPLAWGWRGNWRTRQKSFLIMSSVPGKSLERWVEEKLASPSTANWSEKKRLTEEIARLAKRFHGAGFFHRDFYLCHIFISESQGKFQLALLDLARVFQPHLRIRRWRVKDLAQLNYSASIRYFSSAMRIRFAKKYFGCEKLSTGQKSLLREVMQKTESIARHDSKMAMKRQFLSSSEK